MLANFRYASEFSLYIEIFTATKISFDFGALYIFVFYDILLLKKFIFIFLKKKIVSKKKLFFLLIFFILLKKIHNYSEIFAMCSNFATYRIFAMLAKFHYYNENFRYSPLFYLLILFRP